MRNLVIVLGDQLDAGSSAFDGFDPALDAVWMAEVAEESTHVWTAKQRIAVFLAAMRHFRDELRASGRDVRYQELAGDQPHSLAEALARDLESLNPERIIITQPGEHRVLESLRTAAGGTPFEVREDRHFLCSIEDFRAHSAGRKQLRMEFFYRQMRKAHGVLMTHGQPAGGTWNFDAENRSAFGRNGPGMLPEPILFEPDPITSEVIDLVNRRFADHPGTLDRFTWPVTRAQAQAALEDFIENRLPLFGLYQDAMWLGEPWLFHSRIAVALNLKLLDPREAITAAERAYREGRAPLAAVEGFIRQILGWREYVRGIYWTRMPDYANGNFLNAHEPLPAFYWNGETEMACLQDAITGTLELGYAHHIQRLMVTGLYALLLGVEPREVHEWYLAVYVDAVEWVELPNTIGMSQFADGGYMASKPYAATGKYIQRMSNACGSCRFNPAKSTGEDACPFTTLYWDFLLRNRERLAGNQRMSLQLKNLDRLDEPTRASITAAAQALKPAP